MMYDIFKSWTRKDRRRYSIYHNDNYSDDWSGIYWMWQIYQFNGSKGWRWWNGTDNIDSIIDIKCKKTFGNTSFTL